MKTSKEFNNKYKKYLEDRFYGLAIDNPKIVKYLDNEFKKEIELNPNFSYQQIKTKFNFICVYANSDKCREWQLKIKELLEDNKNL